MHPTKAHTWILRGLALWLAMATVPAGARAPVPQGPTREAEVRAIIEEELTKADKALKPSAAVVVVLDARTGRVVATAGRREGRSVPGLAREHRWVTGSTLKPLTLAAGLQAGVVTPETVVDCAPRRYAEGELHDWKTFGRLPLRDALAVSSNVGASRVLDALGLERLLATFRSLRLFDAPDISPAVTDAGSLDAAKLAAGELATTTPLSLAAAYAALFDEGRYHVPSDTGDGATEIVFHPSTAAAMLDILEGAVSGPHGTGRAAVIDGHRVLGKTGTAELDGGRTWASFVGAVVDADPREVILVGFESGPDATGGKVAAPLFARIAERLVALDR